MGNQNSANHVFSHQPTSPSAWTRSFPRDARRIHKCGPPPAHYKVLPQRIPGQRLRPTDNGLVLQTQGTITPRRAANFANHPLMCPPQMTNIHSISMSTLHQPPSSFPSERANSMHELHFAAPPSKFYASEPDLRKPVIPPQEGFKITHQATIINESPTKGKIKSKKKNKAPPPPPGSELALDSGNPYSSGQFSAFEVPSSPSKSSAMSSGTDAPKSGVRKIGLFKKKNESKKSNSELKQKISLPIYRKASKDLEGDAAIKNSSPSQELRMKAKSLDSLHQNLRGPSPSPMSKYGYNEGVPLFDEKEHHLEASERVSTVAEVQSRNWHTIERESKKKKHSAISERKPSTIERETRNKRHHTSQERRWEDRRSAPESSLTELARSPEHPLTSYTSLPREPISKEQISDEWEKAEIEMERRKKAAQNMQKEILSAARRLRKTSMKESPESKDEMHSHTERERESKEETPKTFFFGMEPGSMTAGSSDEHQGPTFSKMRDQEEVRIFGDKVEFSKNSLERKAKYSSTTKESKKETQSKSSERQGISHKKVSRDVEEFAMSIEKEKFKLSQSEEVASGSCRREDGGYHSRQNSGSFYLDNDNLSDDEASIIMNLRPTLPRKQLDIPRFSPNTTWRGLGQEVNKGSRKHNESNSSEEQEAFFEDKIQRFTRPSAPPRGSGEKSADSGISGDAGSPGPTNELDQPVSNGKIIDRIDVVTHQSLSNGTQSHRRAWTPAEDLDDNSFNGSGEHSSGHSVPPGIPTPPKLTSRTNMFSKSPEEQIGIKGVSKILKGKDSSYKCIELESQVNPAVDKRDHWLKRKKKPESHHKFNSLHKLKRSISGNRYGRDADDYTKTMDDSLTVENGWRDNWSMSRSIPNSLNNYDDHERGSNFSNRTGRSKSESHNISREELEGLFPGGAHRQMPYYIQYNSPRHIMYLPEYNSRKLTKFENGEVQDRKKEKKHSLIQHSVRPLTPESERKSPSGEENPSSSHFQERASGYGMNGIYSSSPSADTAKRKGKKFSYQSTVRLLEKKVLEEKLSKEAEENERRRLQEIEAMKKVEQEFQRKREREKKKMKMQLKFMSGQSNSHHPGVNSCSSDENHNSSSSSEHSTSSEGWVKPSPPRPSPSQHKYNSSHEEAAFRSLPCELRALNSDSSKTSSPKTGLFLGIRNWRKEAKRNKREEEEEEEDEGYPAECTKTGVTSSISRQEPDGAPASSTQKAKDDIRSEIIAASRRRSGNTPPSTSLEEKWTTSNSQSTSTIEITDGDSQDSREAGGCGRRSTSRSSRQSRSSPLHLTQELSELRQERRKYMEYRQSRSHPRSPPVSSFYGHDTSDNYRREFCYGNAQSIASPSVTSARMRSHATESEKHSKYSASGRHSAMSGAKTFSTELNEASSNASSSASYKNQNGGPVEADSPYSRNQKRHDSPGAVDSSPARFLSEMLTPYGMTKGYKPVAFSPPPPTKILHVN